MEFELVCRTNHVGGAAELKLPGDNQPIFEVHPVLPRYLEGKPGILHIAFLVDNPQATPNELKANGVKIRHDSNTPSFQKEIGRTLVNTEELGSFNLQFVDERKPPITR